MAESHEEIAIESIGEALLPSLEESEESESAKYEFDEDFQRRIAALSIRDVNFNRRTEGLIKPDYFDDGLTGLLVALGQEHFLKYRTTPENSSWNEIIKDALRKRRVRSDQVSDVVGRLKAIRKADLSDGDYIVDKVADFAKVQAIQNGFLDAVERFESGDLTNAQQILEKAFAVGANEEHEEFDYWEDIERRTELRKEKAAGMLEATGVPSGINKIDQYLYHKGWGRKELSVFMGGPKKGKSMALGEFAMRASRQGYNALYVSLEVSTEIIMSRMDANVAGVAVGELEDHISDVDSKIKTAGDAIIGGGKVGKLKVTDFPSGTLKPSELKRLIEGYRSQGVTFDLICVDYADIMAPEHRTGSAIEDSKSIWLALRALAYEENAAVLTATQTNREGYTSSVAKAENVAEDFNKIRIADLVISINRDEEETRQGKARLHVAASRNQAGDITFNIEQDIEKMRFLTKVDGYA